MAQDEAIQIAVASQWQANLYDSSSFNYSWTVAHFRDNMPSVRSLARTLFSTLSVLTQSTLGFKRPLNRLDSASLAASISCPHPQLSCHNSTAVENLCCFNAPGGSLLQTQFWDTDPASGPSDSWTIHGLWPDNCDGTYSANCDAARSYDNISAILKASGNTDLLDYMQKYWTSNVGSAENFWKHEWDKHGTCISTLNPECYSDYRPTEEVPDFFQRTVNLFKSLPTYDWLKAAGISPSADATYEASKIQQALSSKHGASVYLGCGDDGSLTEVWYFFNVKGSVQTGKFVPSEPVGVSNSCPDDGVKYLPKKSSGGGGGGPSQTATSTSSPPSPTGPAFSGKGYLNVITGGGKKGCIISGGTWYTSGTCATFSATSSSSDFTLKSSKGDCAVSNDKLSCGAGVSEASNFTGDGTTLLLDGKADFFADAVPSGTEQGSVYTSDEGHSVGLSIEWQGV